MKVLRISHSGGVTAYRERERQLVARHPVQVRLVIPDNWNHLGSDKNKIDEPFPVIKSKTYGTGNIPLFFYSLNSINKQLLDFKPDIVDIHEEPYSVSCFEIVKAVQHHLPKSSIVFYSAQNIKKNYPPPFKWTERYVYDSCDGAYPCSDGVRDVLRQKGFVTNSDVIPLGVDLDLFKPLSVDRTSVGLQTHSTVIGYFGRLEHCKGLDFVFQALTSIPPEQHWQMLIVGNGEYTQNLKDKAQSLGIADRIVWIGEVTASDVPKFINMCDVMVVPSISTPTWKEQFGRAVTESMACGVPVISSDSGSLPEVVGDAGIVVPEQDSQALSAALKSVIGDVTLRTNLAAKSVERVNKYYTWKIVADSMYAFYNRALEIRRARN
ncbi:MAG TPA: glycosyltransferase [Drouetiella sp.]